MGHHHREVASTRRASPKLPPGGDKPGLDVHCCRSRRGVACSRHPLDGQYMRPRWQQGAIAVTLYDAPCRHAIDLKIETDIPSEVRHSVHDEAARRVVMIRPEVPRSGFS
jgi:hypothetical protein